MPTDQERIAELERKVFELRKTCLALSFCTLEVMDLLDEEKKNEFKSRFDDVIKSLKRFRGEHEGDGADA